MLTLKNNLDLISNEYITADNSSAKKKVLNYYINEISNLIQSIRYTALDALDVLDNSSSDEDFSEHLKELDEENTQDRKFIKTFGPAVALYSLMNESS